MPGPLAMAGIMAALGIGKSELVDRPAAGRARKREAEVARWSPWTGMAPSRVGEADPFGSAMQGGFSGAALGQAMDQGDAYKKYLEGLQAKPEAFAAMPAGGPQVPGYAPPQQVSQNTPFSQQYPMFSALFNSKRGVG